MNDNIFNEVKGYDDIPAYNMKPINLHGGGSEGNPDDE